MRVYWHKLTRLYWLLAPGAVLIAASVAQAAPSGGIP